MFHENGPSHLTCIDWKSAEHRGSIAASLVKGVYLLETDRQKNRRGTSEAQAPTWWEFFDFQLLEELIDQSDSSIYGAIFENKSYRNTPSPHQHHNQQNCSYSAASQTQTGPRFIIAFRGTLLKFGTMYRDIKLDVKYFLNELTRDPRYQNTKQIVQDMVSVASGLGEEGNFWLAGHSLGSAIALQVGKEMAKERRYFETYLFNPPYISLPVGSLIKNQALKDGFRVASSVFKVVLSSAARRIGSTSSSHHQHQMHGPDDRGDFNGPLRNWMPYLFVNPNDPICAEYIRYFEEREKMEAMGLGTIARAATQESTMSLLLEVMGRDGETSHLLPSALVIKNMSTGNHNLKMTHGLLQWCKSHPSWHATRYQFT